MSRATNDGASPTTTDPVDGKAWRRERPLLLPSNRKLRHLQGISLRNLTLAPPSARIRRQTIDDESLPKTWKSPAKLLAQRETRKLEHSRSSIDLKLPTTSENDSSTSTLLTQDSSSTDTPRPGRGVMRRRSTLSWANFSPDTRQKKLESVASGRMADTWFSLHCAGNDEPVYISEVIEKAMNPSFRFFDLNSCGPLISRLDDMAIKVWAKNETLDDYNLLVELQVNLQSLQFIGKTLENSHHPLPQNCIVFHLSDGVYTSFTDLPPEEPSIGLPRVTTQGAQSSSSYDALMRLSTLDDCIQDALATRERLASQITHLLKTNEDRVTTVAQVPLSESSLTTTKRYCASQKRLLKNAISRRGELQMSLNARREAMLQGQKSQARAKEYLEGATTKLSNCRSLESETAEDIHGQRRRICEDLMNIFPIEPVSNGRPLAFTIRGVPLPANSNFGESDEDEEATAAALGHVAHVVYLLSFYLSIPLPYPVQPYASNSFVRDPISLMPRASSGGNSTSSSSNTQPNSTSFPSTSSGNGFFSFSSSSLSSAGNNNSISNYRTFPLYVRGAVRYRFEYAVFLLNKDIELLLSRQSLKVLDIRHTLPNLKYLLYVLAAGKGDLPARKAGGVRGLLVGRVTPTADGLFGSLFERDANRPGSRGSLASTNSGIGGGVGVSAGNVSARSGDNHHHEKSIKELKNGVKSPVAQTTRPHTRSSSLLSNMAVSSTATSPPSGSFRTKGFRERER
ncbi:hypothetical protein L228DRAFT_280064 [Xylona heveae TC161]|uniref:Autophagy-related protein 14 n=1 Tax=Xylona heveae (strain CBS 132557 / TC161) TaxID=1328760 RepID=A0A165K2U0_XYLHT|nr:hypothetical protein L228DRAFT_280064 [Xylona heveae TC161]KZF26923.1 hypothetical protein L228DRAFT_280064 [Xylona heveae TC161]